MSLAMIPHIHHWTPSTNVDYLCRLQMFTSNVDHSYTCWTDRRPTYPWHFPTPYITFVIFSYITSVIWTNRQCYVFVWPIVYPPIPGIFLLLLLLHEPVSNFHFQSLIYHIQVSWPLNPYIFWKLMMSAIQIQAKYKHKDNISYVDKDAKGIIEWNNSVLYFQNLFVISFSKIYHIIGVIGFPFICLCICICPCICLCICIFVWIWIADIISFQKIYGLRGTWSLTAVLQLIYELRKNCCGTGRDGWTGRDGRNRRFYKRSSRNYKIENIGS